LCARHERGRNGRTRERERLATIQHGFTPQSVLAGGSTSGRGAIEKTDARRLFAPFGLDGLCQET
jgi:hypothetical protein